MVSDEFAGKLRQIVGDNHVSVSRAHTELYSYDGSLAKGAPGVVVFPANTDEASRVVRTAHAAGINFVPRGFGTNLSGGTVLPSGGMVVCLSRLNRILSILPQRRCAVVQPGVTNLELQDALAQVEYFYAPDPASQKVATLGGNVGENSGGPHCLKYGVTTNHILGLEAILSDGNVVRLGGPVLDPPGYDLRGILIGSEGTLAIVTEVTVRILPKPESVITQLAIYNDVADAARSVSDIISAGIVPATLEMMDAPIIKAVEDSYACGYPRDAAAVLIIEVEGPLVGLKEQARRIHEVCMQNNCREINAAKNDDERGRLWEGRRGAFGAVARLAPNYLVNDCTVPRTKLPQALARVSEIVNKYGFEHGNVFHAGDGNLHPLILFDSRHEDQLHRVHEAGWEIMQACVELGGTISGEHGIGLEKMEAMRLVFSDVDIAAQKSIQDAFDPPGLLNPGKIFPDTGTAVKSSDSNNMVADVGIVKPSAAEDEMISTIRQAAAEKRAILPLGNGGHQDYGNQPAESADPVHSAPLADIVELDSPNQMVTVGAGMSLQSLQKLLAAHQQWLPVRPPLTLLQHSIGGLTALGACGPERMIYGAPRDLLLGLSFISGEGRFISTGGRVVKNVAGYDLTRLMTGSAGTLGLITRLSFRIAALPAQCTVNIGSGSLKDCAQAAAEIQTSHLGPVSITAKPANGDSQDLWKLFVGFEGISQTIESQVNATDVLFKQTGLNSCEVLNYRVHEGLHGSVYADLEQSPVVLRIDLPQDRLKGFIDTGKDRPAFNSILLDFACGRILAGAETIDDGAWLYCSKFAADADGHAVLEKAPSDFKKQHDVFGQPRPEWKIMHRIKGVLDPHGIFAPGRLPGKV